MKIKKLIYITAILLSLFNCKSSKINDYNELKPEIIINDINSFGGSDLANYLGYLEDNNINISDYNETLKSKLQKTEFPYDIYILSEILLDKKKNKSFIESELNSKILKWDTGNWGNKFWNLIKTEKLNVEQPIFFEFKNGIKKYNFEQFLKTKIQNNELGQNPLLFLNDKLTNYEDGNLNSILKEYEIIQIDFIPKKESVRLFGKRGIDGKISVITQ
ncbi:hypothetical protein [Winogradskyella epiphytica]|uniref:hypothetical protein n=1 Tax=Winogradskyella epiphytica TaxID=262005 RepID=UPI0011B5CDEE|nr:hypothetical protein [Winogradskyella epiphytica]